MNSTQTVHVYDAAVETSEVLAAVYQPRGFTVERRTASGQHSVDSRKPGTFIVLRPETMGACDDPGTPLRVVIGRSVDDAASPFPRHRVAACRMSSLFDYRELVSAIDQLLCGSD